MLFPAACPDEVHHHRHWRRRDYCIASIQSHSTQSHPLIPCISAMASFKDLTSTDGLNELDQYLLTRSYIDG
jgi:hypothetical protein